MAKARRPRIERAVQRDTTADATVENARQKIISKLPEITDEIIKQGLAGNTTMLGKLLDFMRETAADAEAQRSNEVLERIAELRKISVEQVLDGVSRHPPDLGTKGIHGTLNSPTKGKKGSVEPTLSPPSSDS